MERLLAWSFVALALSLVLYMFVQAARGTRSPLCLRNFFLLGLIIFQLQAAARVYFTQDYGELPVSDPIGSGFRYLVIVGVFTGLFIATYEAGWLTFGIQNRVQVRAPVPGRGTMIALSILALLAATLFRFTLWYLPVIATVGGILTVAIAAVAVALAAWAWSSNPRNLGALVNVLCVGAGASMLTIFENFGRRNLVCIIIGSLWGLYHGRSFGNNFRKSIIPLTIVGAAGFFAVAAFTATRGHGDTKFTLGGRIQAMLDADIADGARQLVGGQDAASNSLWILENRPTPFPYDTLHSLYYFLVQPVPRVIWPDKPVALGSAMVAQSMAQGKGEGFSFGPGLVGHLANDNPWLALPIYAMLLAAWLRVIDDLLRRQQYHPYMVLPAGVALGNVVALPRGELGLFLFEAVWGMVSAYAGMFAIAWASRHIGVGSSEPQPEGTLEAAHGDPLTES